MHEDNLIQPAESELRFGYDHVNDNIYIEQNGKLIHIDITESEVFVHKLAILNIKIKNTKKWSEEQ